MKIPVFFLVPVLLLGCGGGSSNKDTTKPVIILQGAASVSLEAGTIYTDSGATASDNVDGTITSQIVTVNSVDTDTVGTYEITYNVRDAAGNAATTVTRSVEVVEPVLTGFFTDSAVEGLTYTTATQSGVTDAFGAFEYQAGESIVFSIGNFQLGESVTAAAQMTPLDLIQGAVLPTTSDELRFLLLPGRQTEADAVAFNKLMNILVFLQALDSDKDASNGITIVDGIAAIVDGVTIDITLIANDFKKSASLIEVMDAAVTGDLISSGYIKDQGMALNHFYSEQSIAHSFKALQTSTFRRVVDGDLTVQNIDSFTHDANGDMLTWRSTDAEGVTREVLTFAHDHNGNVLELAIDEGGDGSVERSTSYSFDANGYSLTRTMDTNGDGAANEVMTSTYNARGDLLTLSIDAGADGIVDRIDSYTYDSANNLTLESTDSDADGLDDVVVSYTYDVNGFKATQVDDTNNDGEADAIYTFTRNAIGNVLVESRDLDADGSADEIFTSTYDANGLRLKKTHSYDGATIRYTLNNTFDAYGKMLTTSNVTNGNIDQSITYSYDADGNLETYVLSQLGTIENTKTYDEYSNSNISHIFSLIITDIFFVNLDY